MLFCVTFREQKLFIGSCASCPSFSSSSEHSGRILFRYAKTPQEINLCPSWILHLLMLCNPKHVFNFHMFLLCLLSQNLFGFIYKKLGFDVFKASKGICSWMNFSWLSHVSFLFLSNSFFFFPYVTDANILISIYF